MTEEEKNLIRFVKSVLLMWGNENPYDAEPVSRSLALLRKIIGEEYI